MEVKYDIPQYIASVKMSKKNRILVEGKDDKSHVENLLITVIGRNKVRVDSADMVKGDCKITAKNNRAKVDKIHNYCSSIGGYDNLYFLRDREFAKFEVQDKIIDLVGGHESSGNLYWTSGHSFENYFIDYKFTPEAYRYLTVSEFKEYAVGTFKKILPEALAIIAAISLAARDIGKSNYPVGVIHWSDFEIKDDVLVFCVENWREKDGSEIRKEFSDAYFEYLKIVRSSSNMACLRICRGHTAMRMVQRIFSACLYDAGKGYNRESANKHAEDFSRLKESNLVSVLCEVWLRSIDEGNENYPADLIHSVA